jgi:hypothetical protein
MMYNFNILNFTQKSNHRFSISEYYDLHSSWNKTYNNMSTYVSWCRAEFYLGPNSQSKLL